MAASDPRQRIDALFDQALDLPPQARAAFLDRETAGEPDIRAEVEALLRLADREAPQLEAGALQAGPLFEALAGRHRGTTGQAADLDAEQDASGSEIGHWRLLRPLGRGGMGTVYLAERSDAGFVQHGALKRLHTGLGSGEFERRFAQERQILAALNHRGIARLLDGGHDEGRPYLVMEYVEGQAVDAYCDQRQLDIEQRLALFVRICHAVAHAHRHLIVHRDIKPSNIVVTAEGDLKLLDFGIAKVLGDTDMPLDPVTRTLIRVFTPEYAAPEQVTGAQVTTATDVYQLGLLLYELLCGQRAQSGGGSQATLERAICENEPARPSQAVSDDAGIAAARGTTPSTLRRRLRGDLDNIVLKALRKAPERRYESALALASDIDRWREQKPVQARPEGWWYRSVKFVRRHPFGVAASTAMLTVLIAYAATVTHQAATIARERDRAQAEATKARQVQALVLQLLEGADPARSGGAELSARELLERGWDGVRKELEEQPELRAELLDTMGEAYRQLGLYERSRPLFDEALAIARKRVDAEPLRLAQALRSRGRLHGDMGELELAVSHLREALKHYRERLDEPHEEIATTLGDLGFALTRSADYAAAEQSHRDALAMRRQLHGDEHPDVADSLVKLGMTLRNQGDYAAAEPLLAEALALRRRLLPATHPHLAHNLSDLAMLRSDLGEYQSAEALYRESLALTARAHGARHPHVATVMNNLARLLQRQNRHAEALQLLEDALAIRRTTLGEHHYAVGMNFNDLGQIQAETGDLDGAEARYRQALAAYPPGHPWRAATVLNLGRLAELRGSLPEAEALYRQAPDGQEQHYGTDHDRVANVLVALAGALQTMARAGEAEPLLRRALAIYRQRLPEGHLRIAEALVPLARLLADDRRPTEAEPLLREALQIRQAALGREDALTVEAAEALASMQDERG